MFTYLTCIPLMIVGGFFIPLMLDELYSILGHDESL